MKVGVNWSGQRELEALQKVLENTDVDFIEILIDNFLVTDTSTIEKILDGRRCSFHIMNSQFLHSSECKLRQMADMLKELQRKLRPMYISDHVGMFEYENKNFPTMLEISYSEDNFELIREKVIKWQSYLDCQLLLENYASIIPQEYKQSTFYEYLLRDTDAGLLFDVSNAVIAEKNMCQNKEDWLKIIRNFKTNNFHIAGYEKNTDGDFWVDTHSNKISKESYLFLKEILEINKKISISIERDDNFLWEDWSHDVNEVRKL